MLDEEAIGEAPDAGVTAPSLVPARETVEAAPT